MVDFEAHVNAVYQVAVRDDYQLELGNITDEVNTFEAFFKYFHFIFMILITRMLGNTCVRLMLALGVKQGNPSSKPGVTRPPTISLEL